MHHVVQATTTKLMNYELLDISASKRYYKEDIVEPEFTVNKDGTMDVPTKPGIGVEVNMKNLDKVTVNKKEFKAGK